MVEQIAASAIGLLFGYVLSSVAANRARRRDLAHRWDQLRVDAYDDLIKAVTDFFKLMRDRATAALSLMEWDEPTSRCAEVADKWNRAALLASDAMNARLSDAADLMEPWVRAYGEPTPENLEPILDSASVEDAVIGTIIRGAREELLLSISGDLKGLRKLSSSTEPPISQ